jgi:hypothetical protein
MVERVNGTIKRVTILRVAYNNKLENMDLKKYFIFYMFYRRHGGVRRELKVKTSFNAIEKWYELKPEIFNMNPSNFKNKLLTPQTN